MNSRIAADRVEVVDEQAHAHAAHRGVAHVAQQQVTGLVVLDQVVLDVERVRRALGELDPRVERVEPSGISRKPGQARSPGGVDAFASWTRGLSGEAGRSRRRSLGGASLRQRRQCRSAATSAAQHGREPRAAVTATAIAARSDEAASRIE